MKKLILFLTMLFLITAASAKIEQHEGFPVSAETGLKASLIAQDLDRDGKLEIIAAPENRKIRVFNHTGDLEWKNIGGREQSDTARVPLVSNLSGDSRLEVLSYGNPNWSEPTFYMWDAAGAKLKDFRIGTNLLISSPAITKEGIILTGAAPGTTSSVSSIDQSAGVYAFDTQGNKLYLDLGKSVNYKAPISIGDIDGDGIDEAVILTQDIGSKNPVDGKVWVIRVNYTQGTNIIEGKILWNMSLAGDARGAAIGDLNRDGVNEIVVTSSSGVYIFSQSGVELYNNSEIKSNLASPAIGDLDRDGVNEVVIASGEYKKIYVISNGSLKDFSSGEWVSSNLALADLNGDGKLEIVGGDIHGSIYVWDYKGHVMEHDSVTYDEFTSVVVADLEGDGRKEIILGNNDAKIYVYTYMSSLADTTPPVTTDNTDKQWHNSSVTVTLTASDDNSGVSGTYHTIDGTEPTINSTKGNNITFSGDGVYTLKYFSVDKARNKEAVKAAVVKVDKTPPATIDNVDKKWYNSSVVVTLTPYDNGSGVQNTYYSVDGFNFTTGTSATISGEGNHTLNYYSIDNANNVEQLHLALVMIDLTPPATVADAFVKNTISDLAGAVSGTASWLESILSWLKSITGQTTTPQGEISAPAVLSNGACYNNDVGITLSASDRLSGVAGILYNLDGTGWLTYGGLFSVSSEGQHILKYKSTDYASNAEKEENTGFTVDRTPPEARIRFDSSSKDIKVYNNETGGEASYTVMPALNEKESSDEDSEKGWELRQYTLKDCAGNSNVLVLKHKKEGTEINVKVISTRYNSDKILNAAKNKMQAEFSLDKNGSLGELEQKSEVPNQFDVAMKYNARKNETEIKVKFDGQKEHKETREGIVISELWTDKGNLKIKY